MGSNLFNVYENFFDDANEFFNSIEPKNLFVEPSTKSSEEKDDSSEIIEASGRLCTFLINEKNNKMVMIGSESMNNRSSVNATFIEKTIASRFFIHCGETLTICLSYIPFQQNIPRESVNVDYGLSFVKPNNKVEGNNQHAQEYSRKVEGKSRNQGFWRKWFFFCKKNQDTYTIKDNKNEPNLRRKYHISSAVPFESTTKYNKETSEDPHGDSYTGIEGMTHSDYSRNMKDPLLTYGKNKGNIIFVNEDIARDDKSIHTSSRNKYKTKDQKRKNKEDEEKKKKKKKEEKKGKSYAHLLKRSSIDYDPFYLYNPRFKQGKHHTVMHLQSYNVSIIPFVKPKKLKEEVNELFSELNPWIHKSLTLSKLRNLKIDLFNLITRVPEIDISTIACAWVFFERLIFKGYVHKYNRKLYVATCLVLSLKFYQHDEIQILEKVLRCIQKLDKKENLTPASIFSVEFLVYRLLDFSLQHTYENIRPHIHQYLDLKDLKFEDVHGESEELYLYSNYLDRN